MPQGIFQLYNIIGGFLWVASVTYLGYYGGAWLDAQGINVEALVIPIILAAVLFTTLSPLVHILRDKESRAIFLKKLGIKR